MKNLEIKAPCKDLNRVLQSALALGAVIQWQRIQQDTYFRVPKGKLKLRETDGFRAELIAYHRPARRGARVSDYEVFVCAEPTALKKNLATVLGIDMVITKDRTLLLWQNVRIHLDSVSQLGNFIELEAMLSDEEDPARSADRIDYLLQVFQISRGQLIGKGYYELSQRRGGE